LICLIVSWVEHECTHVVLLQTSSETHRNNNSLHSSDAIRGGSGLQVGHRFTASIHRRQTFVDPHNAFDSNFI